MATFGTFTAGQVLTAAELNTAGAWQSYTPTWTQTVAVTKTVNWARYTELGKTIQVQIKMTASSSGTASGLILVGLPVAASADNRLMGIAAIVAAASFEKPLVAVYDSSTTIKFRTVVSDQLVTTSFLSSGAPNNFNIVSGDIIYCQLSYEAA
jgi:hypothetical protein